MTPEELLDSLRERGVELHLSGLDLRVRAPKGALTDQLTRLIAEHKPALVHLLGSGSVAGIRPKWRGEDSELSFMQESMWYFSKAGVASAYNVVAAYHLVGELDYGAMQRSINDLVARHAMLRAFVVEDEGRPLLRYATSLTLELPLDDLSGLPHAERMTECHDRIRAEYFHDFDVGRPPLVYFRLFKVSEVEWVLYCNLHHMLTDAFSFSVIVRELAAGYAARREGLDPALPPLPLQFPDWIGWQRRQHESPRVAEDIEYWKHTLRRPLPNFELRPDRPRKRAFDLSGADYPFEVSPEKRDRMSDVGRTVGATPFMVMMASLKLAIHYLTGSEDVIVGTPVSGRNHPALGALIGGFLNTIPVRSVVDPDRTLRDFLLTVKADLLGALAHQGAPFKDVVRSLGLPHDPSRTPIYQVSLNLWDISDRPVVWGNLQAARFHVSTPWTHAEYAMWLMNSVDQGIEGMCTFATELFDRESGLRMGEAVHQVLDFYLEHPERKISELSLVTPRERADLARWNATTRLFGGPTLLHELLLSRAEEAADREAIRDELGSLSYGQLRTESARIAGALQASGIGRGSLVAVICEREARVLPLLIGILQSGAGYLPLDPEFPRDRLAFILGDAGAAAVACSDRTRHLVPEGLKVFDLDQPWPDGNGGEVRDVGSQPSDLAYQIYTSGSTGRPKGVRVTHGNVVNFLNSMRERPGLTELDVVVATTSFSFDISALELYLPLAVGARLILASRDDVVYPDKFIKKLATWRPTLLQATPSFWAMLFDAGWEGDKSLRVLAGGEAMPADLGAKLLACVGELWNMYGPTETTVWSTVHHVRDTDLAISSIPIGTPIANTNVLVVDNKFRPVPTGTAGELLIGGAGVSEGYHSRPELTADRFIEVEEGGRMYRTGDRARFRHSGELEYLGRLDWQFKMRGHRIEPGEIEVVLRSHHAVRDTVVGPVEVAAGDVRLVAWVAFESDRRATPTELRTHLRKGLPSYMIPAFFVEVEAIPRTPAGKTDRAALPAPKIDRGRGEDFRPPRPGTEELIAGIWRRHLHLDAVSRDANFFEIGGHSLLSVRVVAELERRTGHRLDPRLLFFYSLEQVAATLGDPVPSAPSRA